jgi:hypothetical protein
MDWENFQLWYNYLLNIEYKDTNINKTINEFSRVLIDQKSKSKENTNKENISKEDWKLYGKLNLMLSKLKHKFNVNLELPRERCQTAQKFNRSSDVKTGTMYAIPAISNGIDTSESGYFYVPIHKTRRHIHGVPNEFLESYVYNMIETAEWEKVNSTYYTSSRYINECAIYKCPEKFYINNILKKTNKNETEKKEQKCCAKINVFEKILELEKFFNSVAYQKIYKFFIKKLIDNFRINFPKKSKYITYCVGECIHTVGYIHNGIPNGKQNCYSCKINYCRECGTIPFHTGRLCKFEDDVSFENPENYRKCPSCSIWIEKEEGCDHIKCNCGVHFCYHCRGVLCANDPYYHICKMNDPDPHFRDFQFNHQSAQYEGEIACNCKSCI